MASTALHRFYRNLNQKIVAIKTLNNFHDFKGKLVDIAGSEGLFLYLKLSYIYNGKSAVDENLYWLQDRFGNYSGLGTMPPAKVTISATLQTGTFFTKYDDRRITVHISNPAGNSIAFFNRISLVNSKTKKRILPVFYNNNYISVLPGGEQTVTIDYSPRKGQMPMVCIEGWNVKKQYVSVKRHEK